MKFYEITLAQDCDAIVVAFDICSSSDIMEQLISRGEIEKYAKFLGKIKEYLAKQQDLMMFVLYKFTGDGWILLFPKGANAGTDVFNFMRDFSAWFKRAYKHMVEPYLDSPPETQGITFGVDCGSMHRMKMYQRNEYIGRAINVACRLQAAVKDKDNSPGYKALVSRAAHNGYLSGISGYKSKPVVRVLRNILGGKPFASRKVKLI